MSKKALICGALIVLFVAATQATVTATLITDGIEDFEDGVLDDWTVTDAFGSVVIESNGNDYALLEEDGFVGSISQDITLESYHTTLEFDYAIGLFDDSLDPDGFYDSFQLALYNDTDSVILFQDDIDFFDASVSSDPDWMHVTVDLSDFFLDDFWGDSATLSFDIIDVDWWINSALAIDNVVLGSGVVPEPATLILFGAGLLGLGARRGRTLIRRFIS